MTTATTKGQARKTQNSAKATARSAASTARNARSTANAQGRAVRGDLVKHGKRVTGAAQAEVQAVASQPTRPLFFALGIADRTVGAVKEIPSVVLHTPVRARQRVIASFALAGDLAEKAQKGYTDVAKDGESVVGAIKRQDSTQLAVKLATRARRRSTQAAHDAEKAVGAGVDAATEAVTKIG